MGCIEVSSVNNGSGNICFSGKNSDFNKYLKSIILDNDLSIMPNMKGNLVTSFILNKMLEKEPKKYNLDKMFESSRDIEIYQDEETKENEFKIDRGHDLKFIVPNDTFVFNIFENLKKVHDYCDDNSLEKKNVSSKKRKPS